MSKKSAMGAAVKKQNQIPHDKNRAADNHAALFSLSIKSFSSKYRY